MDFWVLFGRHIEYDALTGVLSPLKRRILDSIKGLAHTVELLLEQLHVDNTECQKKDKCLNAQPMYGPIRWNTFLLCYPFVYRNVKSRRFEKVAWKQSLRNVLSREIRLYSIRSMIDVLQTAKYLSNHANSSEKYQIWFLLSCFFSIVQNSCQKWGRTVKKDQPTCQTLPARE